MVRSGACQEVVLRGDEVDLGRLPVQTCWPGDAAPFITLPAVITRDPRNGGRNVGMYRLQVVGPRETAMHWQLHKDGRADYLFSEGRMEVAVALGLDPVTAYSASAPLPKHIDELMFAGFLRGEAVELVKGVTVDLEVPASAEIVLEGYVEKGELVDEGPFGDHTGYYTPAEPFPLFHVTAMTMRRGAIYPSIVVGKPPQEDAWLGKATERIFLPAIRASVPEIVDYDLPVAGAFHNCAIVSIRKAFPGHARKVMHAIWGLGLLSLTKAVVVVDAHVDVHDYEQVFFYVGANVDPARDVVLADGPVDHLDHSSTLQFLGGKIGIDATAKGPDEGAREWPPEIEMSDEVRALVSSRWDEYGIPLDPAAGNGSIRHSSAPVCRDAESDRGETWSRAANTHTVHGRSCWPWGMALGHPHVLLAGIALSWEAAAVGSSSPPSAPSSGSGRSTRTRELLEAAEPSRRRQRRRRARATSRRSRRATGARRSSASRPSASRR